jgi:hypothetical protein
MVQAADKRMRDDAPDRLNRPQHRRVLVQRTMCPGFVIITCIRAQDTAQMLIAQYHEMVNALAAD